MNASTTLQLPHERNKVDMLNVLRVVATMFVFLLHGKSYVEGIDEAFAPVSILAHMPAWAGVWILFFLSGYLMQKGFLAGRYEVWEDGKLSGKALWRFYLGRFIKIAPAYYIYIFVFLILRGDTYFFDSPWTALKILTFTFNGNGGISGIGHLWYISLAMWFYVLAPFFARFLTCFKTKKSLWILFGTVAAIGLLFRNVMYPTPLAWYDYCYTFLPTNIDLFFGGMIACSLTEQYRDKLSDAPRKALKIFSPILFFAIVLFNAWLYWQSKYYIYQYLLPTAYLGASSLILWVYDTESFKRSRPTWEQIRKNPLRLVDRFSPITYAFYIFHIATFRFWEAVLLLWEPYASLSVYLRYPIFMVGSFLLSLMLGVWFTKMFSVFRLSKKNA